MAFNFRHCEARSAEAIHHPPLRKKRSWIASSGVAFFVMTVLVAPAFADDGARALELAQKMHEFRPVAGQVEGAVEQFAQRQPEAQRAAFKTAMLSVLNVEALEKKSVQAYVDTFTLPELEAMVEYYAKPEARSASDKFNDYAAIIYPEIIKMLDSAAMRVKTGGN
ncbi:MAG: hypothetical protein ACRBCT_07740 [Alphaproteobacteria bacterium]